MNKILITVFLFASQISYAQQPLYCVVTGMSSSQKVESSIGPEGISITLLYQGQRPMSFTHKLVGKSTVGELEVYGVMVGSSRPASKGWVSLTANTTGRSNTTYSFAPIHSRNKSVYRDRIGYKGLNCENLEQIADLLPELSVDEIIRLQNENNPQN